jgi:hypothetical protein
MKTKLLFSLLVLAAVASHALAASDTGKMSSHSGRGHALVTPVENPATTSVPTDPAVEVSDPKQALQDFDSLMIALTQKFSATLTTIAEAAKRGELSSEQAREMSAQQYELTHMQFELLSLWRGIEEQDLTKTPDVQEDPDPKRENEVVTVALPFSSLQLNPSLAKYLNLTPTQLEGIQQIMTREQRNSESLTTALRFTREKVLAIGSEHIDEKQLKALADTEARLLARLIVANARMQSKIYKLLSPEQQERLSDLERTQSAVTNGR